ncbi:putative nuclease HARBI1 [Dreissena polymorpha]|uniref:putative nuclease HARBI1 n=1 Tax=Dreissena polymorpha TaxID=45954 RepID=UPI0022644FF7|nr:putative nuclease HARBI1 [Dreissena polymorpha]
MKEDRKVPIPRLFRERIVLENLRDEDIVSRYRLSRGGIERLVVLIGEEIAPTCRRSHAIDPVTQILASLRYLAKGDFYSEVGDIHGISKSSFCRILQKFISAVNQKLKNIRFPQGPAVLLVKQEFFRKCQLPNVVGAVDGTLVPIIKPAEAEEAYVCRKGFHAINVQAVVDANMRFTDVVSRWPGATHDAAVFDSSGVKEYLSTNDVGHLLGDSGYPLRTYLMTPVPHPSNDDVCIALVDACLSSLISAAKLQQFACACTTCAWN